MTPTSVRKTPMTVLLRRPSVRYLTVEFQVTPGRWLGSTHFVGFYVGSKVALRRRIVARLSRLARQGATGRVNGIPASRVEYRIVTHTRTRQGIEQHIPGSEIAL